MPVSFQLPALEHIQCNFISEVNVKFTDERGKVLMAVVPGSVTSYTTLLPPYVTHTVVINYKNNAGMASAVDILHMNRTLETRKYAVCLYYTIYVM